MASERKGHRAVEVGTPVDLAGQGEMVGPLRRLERIFADCPWPQRRLFLDARRRARERALATYEAGGSTREERQPALVQAAAELFGALRIQLAGAPLDAARVAAELEDAGLPRMAVAREVLRSPELLAVAPSAAVEAQLVTLVAFAPLRNASLWTLDAERHAKCICHAGDGGPSRGARQLAQRLLAGGGIEPTPSSGRRLLIGLPVGRWLGSPSVLVAHARPWMRERGKAFLREALPVLGAILERDALLAASVESERALAESSERRLARLGFDLHDGPIQELALLADDVRLLSEQLELALGPLLPTELIPGRIEDLEAQLAALDAELRRLSSEVQASPAVPSRPFAHALDDRSRAFALRTNVEPRLRLEGEIGLVSASQQIALLNIVSEALNNIREHADASEVEVAVSVDEGGVEAQITDNGRGFDPAATRVRAAREGRIGLVAIAERVRLLGGQCEIDSRPGGPTVVAVRLAPWRPLREGPKPRLTSA
jgi:signal transduction histidine kinase